MLISGSVAAQQPAAPSTAVTDDGLSVRQIVVNPTANGAGSEAATASFRNFASADRISSSQRRNNLVLFVKSNDNESDGQPRTMNNASVLQSQQNAGGSTNSSNNSMAENGEDGGDGEQEDLLSLVVSTATSGGSTMLNALTGAARKPLLTAAIVLLYFILLDIVLLKDNERLNRILRRVRAADNDALVLLSSSLVRQMKEAKKDLHDALALKDPPATLERLEMIQHKALALERVCNRSLARLHMQLFFPGSVEDLTFLVEEHVNFDVQLQSLAAEELAWAQTVMASSVVHLSDDAVPDSQKFVLGSHAGAYAAEHGGPRGGDGNGDGNGEGVNGDGEPQSNPHRNVRLERVQRPGTALGPVRALPATKGRVGRGAAAARRGSAKGKNAQVMEEVEELEEVTGGVLRVLKNRLVAFCIICALLAAVLRMG